MSDEEDMHPDAVYAREFAANARKREAERRSSEVVGEQYIRGFCDGIAMGYGQYRAVLNKMLDGIDSSLPTAEFFVAEINKRIAETSTQRRDAEETR